MLAKWLKAIKYEWLLVLGIFILAAAIRAYPEIKAGYWPIGYDSFNTYLTELIKFNGSFTGWLLSANLMYILIWPIYQLFHVDPSLMIKISGCVIYGVWTISFYWFCRKVLKWPLAMSLFSALILIVQLASLRLSWDLFRNLLALTFLFYAVYFLEMKKKTVVYWAIFAFFSLLIILSNQLVAALWCVVIIFHLLRHLFHKDFKNILKLIISVAPSIILFIITMKTSISNTFGNHIFYWGEANRVMSYFEIYKNKGTYQQWADTVLGIFSFSYLYLLGPAILGFFLLRKNFTLTVLTLWLLIGTFSSLLSGGYGLFVWSRWLFMLVIPLTIYAVYAIFFLGNKIGNSKKINQKNILTVRAIGLVILLAYLGLFVKKNLPFVTVPNKDVKAPFLDTRYNDQIPPSMINNAIGYENLSNILACIDYINENTPQSAVIMIDNRYRGIALIKMDYRERIIYTYPWSKKIPKNLLKDLKKKNIGPIYTIWNIQDKLSGFDQVFTSGDAAVYREKTTFKSYQEQNN